MSPREDRTVLRDSARLEALTSPVRLEIVESLQSGPAPIAEIARRMGRPADSLYYHVRKLERVGILQGVGERSAGRGRTVVYALVGRSITVRYDGDSDENKNAIKRTASAFLRATERDFHAAVDAGSLRPSGRGRNASARRRTTRLTPEARRKLLGHLDAIERILACETGPDEGEPIAFTAVLVPIEDRSK